MNVLADLTGLKKKKGGGATGSWVADRKWTKGKSHVCRQLFYSQSQGQ